MTQTSDVDFDISVTKSIVTQTRVPAIDIDSALDGSSVVRANQAVSREHPEGSRKSGWTEKYKEYTVMQQHILFWDRDMDGHIWPLDTYRGFRELGFNILFSCLAVLIIHLNFSYPTRLGLTYFPDPFFRVYVRDIHKAKHGSDSGTYDNEGRFVPQNFENIFAKYDSDRDGAITLSDITRLMKGQRVAADPFGWGAALFEWGTTWLLLQKDGKVYKEDLRQLYDGSLFWRIREQRKQPKGWQQGYGLGGDRFVGSHKVF
ncbi:calcium binding protein Caleosin, putative [Talaromyces stipitatus ATCC 10500]|uniref:Calcium binding protein Caleosin, putative n=1 Tax=Talaromyces stipitatus (strain ATCC 10500 / CBS 375.48 / QM 6759 / NRRL 1006) TaxID=441959 RepID=B8LTU3_TALSN|nr:calcium binding protein Caleosin, putative [Talaromyces stipitatus ATCC 10500]EED23685.1 calcium binding protein Caleosin, putative [Talaromyces stipitatus ATCC 10500]